MISLDDIRGLAALARLKLTGAEEENLQKDISNILEYVGQVSAIPAAKGEEKPMVRNVMRKDELSAVLGTREDLLKAFPTREGDFNVVRQIIQKDE
ncbi:MAG: Asp-tRNA(Asn)/Glu-tRNA(Gln) amidotransferase subunit GatC [Patescibacteria group bacterium]